MKPLDALRALGPGEDAPVEAKQRVYGALLVSLSGAGAAATGAATMSKATTSLTPAAVPTLAGITSSKAIVLAAGIWLIGGATGAALYGALQRERVRVVYVDRPVPANPISGVLPAPEPKNAVPEAMPSAAPSPKTNAARSGGAASGALGSGASELSLERALLDSARANAARGEPGLVLAQVARHLRQFPRGKLAEEREALAIRALLALDRGDEARARAGAFRSAYPNSFLMPVIDSALSAP